MHAVQPFVTESPILIVEDDESIAELERRALTRSGRRTRTVSGVTEALAAMGEESFQAVLLDYPLPDGEPWAVLEAAQRATPRIPVILVTAMGDERIAAEVLLRGGADYLIKTDDFSTYLPAAIERLVRQGEAEHANQRLAAIVESSDDAILSTSLEGVILSWNPAAERLFGHTAGEAIGRSVDILIPPSLVDEKKAVVEAVRRGESARPLETTCVRRDGSSIAVSTTVSPILDAQRRVIGSAWISRDIGERKLLEAQLRQSQKMEAIGQLASGIAHDFNNVLTAIFGYAGILSATLPAHGEGRAEVDEILLASERAAAFTKQLLAFSRHQVMEPVVLEINDLVSGLGRMLESIVGENVRLVSRLSPSVGNVRADRGQIEQVIVNLVANARDAMPEGGRLTIETSNADLDETYAQFHSALRPGSYVLIAISDTGNGMDAETQTRIFEPFFTTKEKGKGTGLGLATVYGIVKESAGSIWVYSELGKGTTFKIYLPRVVDGPAVTPPRFPAATSLRGTETVLFVDDESSIRTLSRRVLESQGYLVIEAGSGGEALEKFRRQGGKIDLLVTDLVIPDMGGNELATRIREIKPALRTLFISGYTDQGAIDNGMIEATSAFLQKPFVPHTLCRRIRELLDAE